MKKAVSIARAMKEKNRIASWLRLTEHKIRRNNSRSIRIPRAYDVQQVYEESKRLRKRLIETRSAIAEANHGIAAKLVELAEIKNEITFLGRVDTQEGEYPREGSYRTTDNAIDTFTVILSESQISQEIEKLQLRANAIQDEIDEFNASTLVTIEIDDYR